MVILGIFIVVMVGVIALASYDLVGFLSWVTIGVIIGGGLILYDVKSPTETTVSYIETTDASVYNIEIHNPENKILKIRKTETESLRVGAVLYDTVEYELMIGEGE